MLVIKISLSKKREKRNGGKEKGSGLREKKACNVVRERKRQCNLQHFFSFSLSEKRKKTDNPREFSCEAPQFGFLLSRSCHRLSAVKFFRVVICASSSSTPPHAPGDPPLGRRSDQVEVGGGTYTPLSLSGPEPAAADPPSGSLPPPRSRPLASLRS